MKPVSLATTARIAIQALTGAATGSQGATGAGGATGATGAAATGATGATGSAGVGATGATGAGATGATGSAGATGAGGGATGATGAAGTVSINAKSYTATPSTVVLTGALAEIMTKTITVATSGETQYFDACIQIFNTGGAVAAGHINVSLLIDGSIQVPFTFNFPFGTEGLTTIHFAGAFTGTLATGARIFSIQASATAAGLEVVAGRGGMYIQQMP